jgi:hypothetical protein
MHMEREQLMGLYFRLQRDLVEAYTAPTSSDGRIERLTDELAAIHRIVRADMERDEQTSDSTIPGALADAIDAARLSPVPGSAPSSAARSPGRPSVPETRSSTSGSP